MTTMTRDVTATLQGASDAIWAPLAYLILGIGLAYTIATGAVQFRRIPDMVKQLRADGGGDGGMSSFQALVLALASRVGVGSIAGVATAVGAGGPGALVWMAATGLVGCTVGYAEAALSQTFKRQVDDPDRVKAKEDVGGMPWYIKYGLPHRGLGTAVAVVVAVIGLVGYGFLFPGFQVSTIASTSKEAFGLSSWVPATLMTIAVAFVVIGGTHRIVRVAQFLVPVLAVGYLVLAICVIVVNASHIPEALSLIFRSAFGLEPMLGGMTGASVAWGVRRAVFASSNGLGEATFAAAAARTSHPSKQGLVQTFSIYIDVLLICMATGLMMVISGQYNVHDANGKYLIENIPDTPAGATWVQKAIDTMAPGWGAGFIAVAVLLFGFTCLLLYYYYIASTNLLFLMNGSKAKWPINLLKAGTLVIVFLGAVANAELIWALGDIGLGLITWINVACLVLMFPMVRKIHRDYERQRKAGLDPTFDPKALGIEHADFWYTPAAHEGIGDGPGHGHVPVR